MRAFIVRVDDPIDSCATFIKDFKVTSVEQLAGFLGETFYVELYDISLSDDKNLVNNAKQVVSAYGNLSDCKKVITKLVKSIQTLLYVSEAH